MPGLTSSNKVIATPIGKVSHGTITFDSSYPTGGEALAASVVGLDFVDLIQATVRGGANQTYIVQYDKTNKKLIVKDIRPKVRHGQVNGAAAGNVTCTGIVAATDVLTKIVGYCGGAIGTTTSYNDLTSEFAICADNTIGNAAGTATINGRLGIEYWRPADQEVNNTTDLSALVIDFVAYQFNDPNSIG